MKRESAIMRDIRAALNATGLVRIVRNSVGFDEMNRARYGLGTGSPDLVGVLRDGRAFCIEVKTPTGRVRPEQIAWWRAARAWGVLGGIARSVDEALALLTLAVNRGTPP